MDDDHRSNALLCHVTVLPVHRILRWMTFGLLFPLPLMAADEYARPTLALVLGGMFAFVTVGALIKTIQSARLWREHSQEGEIEVSTDQAQVKRTTIIWAVVTLIAGVLTIVAFNWRVLRSEPPLPAPLESTERIGGVKIITVDRQYPDRDAVGVARNASIYIWFVQPMDRTTLIDGKGTVDEADDEAAITHVRAWRGGSPTTVGDSIAFRARSNPNGTIFAFDPTNPIPSGGADKVYVELSGLKTADGQPLFGQEGVYRWSFTFAQNDDRIAPSFQQSFPTQNAIDIPANAGIQLGWSESIDPVSFSSGMKVMNGSTLIPGLWTVAEGERLTEFFPSATCAQNQCRRNISCFPFGGSIEVSALSVDPNQYPRQGVRDFQGNLFGSSTRSLLRYAVGRRLQQTLPSIVEVQPLPDSSGIAVDQPVSALFSTIVRVGSVDKRSVRLGGDGDWRARVETDFTKVQSRIRILHQPFLASQVLQGLVASDVEDIYQNCFAQCKGP